MAVRTAKQIEALKPRPVRYEESVDNGLRVLVHPSGGMTWILRYRSPTSRNAAGERVSRKLTLGPVDTRSKSTSKPVIGHPLTLAQARALASAELERVQRDHDPAADRRESKARAKEAALADQTVETAMVEFMKRYKGRKKQGLRESTRLLTATYFGLKPDTDNVGHWKRTGKGVLGSWKGRSLTSITKRDVIALLNGLIDAERGVTANRTLTVLKTFFQWCVKNDLLASSPAAVVEAPAAEKERERVLTADELVAVWKAADGLGTHPYGTLIKLAILTGARRDELRNARRSEFKDALWTIPGERTKNGVTHIIPLSSFAVDVLEAAPQIGDQGLVFTTDGFTSISGLSQMKRMLDSKVENVAPWTLHDLRRTFYTGLQALGVSMEVAEACVNHRGSIRGAAKHYAHHQYLTEKRAAFHAWANHVERMIAEANS